MQNPHFVCYQSLSTDKRSIKFERLHCFINENNFDHTNLCQKYEVIDKTLLQAINHGVYSNLDN